eukprot:scaffold187519_cov19-Tisochrysis_lutea.AAC.1
MHLYSLTPSRNSHLANGSEAVEAGPGQQLRGVCAFGEDIPEQLHHGDACPQDGRRYGSNGRACSAKHLARLGHCRPGVVAPQQVDEAHLKLEA